MCKTKDGAPHDADNAAKRRRYQAAKIQNFNGANAKLKHGFLGKNSDPRAACDGLWYGSDLSN